MKKYSNATDNSKQIMPGDLFISMPADNAQTYLNDAIAHGAAAIIMPADSPLDLSDAVAKNLDIIKSNDIKSDAAKIAAEYYPDIPKHICAVTGTKGKTSTVAFVTQILRMMGKSSASIGTLGVISDKWTESGDNTTPYAIKLRQWMTRLAADGVGYLATEASSHGLDQRRLEFIPFDSVGFSNLSRDHLDYHKTMENYFAAKSRLFTEFEYGTAVINMDDEYGAKILSYVETKSPQPQIITFGRNGNAIQIKSITADAHGQRIELKYFGLDTAVTSPLVGEFQVYNILMAIGLVIGMGFAPDELPIEKIFAELYAPAGRAEYIGKTRGGGAVYVDYAHTPASLEQIIAAMRPHAMGRTIVLFGCGGNRDAGKRPMMGDVAARGADVVYVTDDNPRFENAADIRAQIMAACPNGIEIGDRATAIATAIKDLKNGDLLIIAGKGHEDYQIINGKKTHFSDREEVLKAIANS
ncbi:MAG: UDP-N-acetylmuramoyl-L-alanyl-D-glutamate--2,6-diaminopimelate ligase [Proteobacteria bacterium]|nr:UDP-N-acetylmuramoyl-L-alanyl-D-glutamate--2,6-diaminopimelate ligase [Pseudomonadota bacterium]